MKIILSDLSRTINIGGTGFAEKIHLLFNKIVPNFMLTASEANISSKENQRIGRDYQTINIRKLKRKTYVGIPTFAENKYSYLTLKNESELLERNLKLIDTIIKYLYQNNGYGFEVHNLTVTEYKNLYSHPENDYLSFGNEDYFLTDPTGLYIGNKGEITKVDDSIEVKAILVPAFEIPSDVIIDTEKHILLTRNDVMDIIKLSKNYE